MFMASHMVRSLELVKLIDVNMFIWIYEAMYKYTEKEQHWGETLPKMRTIMSIQLWLFFVFLLNFCNAMTSKGQKKQ